MSEPLPEGPDHELLAATLQAITRQADSLSRRPTRFWRGLRHYRFAATVAILLSGGALLALLLPFGSSEPVALGAILEHIKTAHTLQFTQNSQGPDCIDGEARIFMKGNRLREQQNDSTWITDAITGEMMVLIPSTKTAVMPSIEGRPGPNT
jgi:hypothetical protein